MIEDIAIEIARTIREAMEAIERRIADQQCGELFVDLASGKDSTDACDVSIMAK